MLKFTPTFIVAIARNRLLPCLSACMLGLVGFQSHAVASTNTHPILQRPHFDFPQLNAKRLFALGMIETGNNDWVIGSAGEVSRYQLMPSVWKNYSNSHNYSNPEVSLQVARQHWFYLASYFREQTGRTPNDFDMYVLWNTRFGYYARRGFSKHLLSAVVRDRAQRFVNLVNRKDDSR